MDFIVVMTILVLIALLIGNISIQKNDDNKISTEPLYDRDTLSIMKTYGLISEDQYREMNDKIKQNI
ncbi:MAG: hypothetical protein ACRCVJ_17070 [Clostridium sp.]|uniref:hypothetical protein n=1 Tax=Clostridium sp. TaxID=1506 RepID=UPI003F3007CF